MAKAVSKEYKGRAGGWYQAGNLGGGGLGGGAGVWISPLSYQMALIVFINFNCLLLSSIAFCTACIS